MQGVAPLDCLTHLPAPPGKGNKAAASLYGGQLLAYAAASAVVVCDVRAKGPPAAAAAAATASLQAPWQHPCPGRCKQLCLPPPATLALSTPCAAGAAHGCGDDAGGGPPTGRRVCPGLVRAHPILDCQCPVRGANLCRQHHSQRFHLPCLPTLSCLACLQAPRRRAPRAQGRRPAAPGQRR
jgi:hypothetical protein